MNTTLGEVVQKVTDDAKVGIRRFVSFCLALSLIFLVLAILVGLFFLDKLRVCV